MKKKLITFIALVALTIGLIAGNATVAFATTSATENEGTPAFGIVDANGNVAEYGSISDMLRDYDAGGNSPATATNYIKLYENISENITISKDVYLDLNGKKITGNITVASGTLYCMDSYTDDYDVKDGAGYAVITGTVNGDVQGLPEGSPISGNERGAGYTPYYPGYMKIVEGNEISFHRVDLGLKEINFKPGDIGISYTCDFSGDQVVARNVKQYGVAISIVEAPNAENMATECGFSIFTKFTAGKAVNTGKSTRLINIMRESYKETLNKSLAETPIYGRAYLQTESGYVFGAGAVTTLKDTAEEADKQLAGEGMEALLNISLDLYYDFETIISSWNIPNIKAAVAEEDEVIKILMIGNSHGVDATKQLNEVFKKAAPNQKVVIGALYHSGCRIDMHLSYIANNEGNYIYYKIDNTMTYWDRTPAHKTDSNGNIITGELSNGNVRGGVTLNHGLLDERWDFITLQQGAVSAAYETPEKNFDGLEDLINYVRTNATGNPKIYWFDTWTNPNDDARAATYSGIGYGTHWYQQYVDYFGLSQHDMYNKLMANVQKKIMPFVEAGKLDGIIDTATAIQYMQDVMGMPEYKVYRDGTHLSDYARVLASAVWYSTFTGDTAWTTAKLPSWIYTDLGTKSYRADQNISPAMREDLIEVLDYVLQPENKFKLPEGTVEAPRLQYVNQMDGVWVCGNITADLQNAKTVAGIAIEKINTTKFTVKNKEVSAEDNDVTITLAGVGDVLLSRTGVNTMKVKTVPSGLTGISVGSVFTFQAK